MDLLSKKIDYRSQAEKDYQTAVYNYRQMFNNIKIEQPAELRKLENLSVNLDSRISAAKIKEKPVAKAKKAYSKKIDQSQKAEEHKKQMICKEILRQEERRKARIEKERFRIELERSEGKKFATRVIDTTQLIPLRLDAKTVIYIKPGVDPEKVKEKFRHRNDHNGYVHDSTKSPNP